MTSTEGFKGFITFSGLVVLVGLTTATVLYTSQSQNISSEASTKNIEPREIEISSVASNTLKITWVTLDKTIGTLFYSNDQSSKCLTDEASTVDCDFVIENGEKTNHTIELKNLTPEKKYFYKIKINNKMYPSNGILLSFTVPKTEAPIVQKIEEVTPTLTPTPVPTAQPTTPQIEKEAEFIESEGFSQ